MGSASSSSLQFLQRFWALALPACLAGLLQPLAGFSDIAVLGRQASVSAVAAVGLSANYFDIAYLSFGFLRMGTTAWLSHWLARDDRAAFRQELVFAIVLAIFASGLIGLTFIGGRELIIVPEELTADFWSYTDLRILGAPFAMLNLVFVGYLIATERGKAALTHAILVHGSNVLLNIIAVEVLAFGAQGVGLATLISQGVGVCFGLALLKNELSMSDFGDAFQGQWWSQLRRSLNLNGLLVLRTWLMQGVFLWAQYSALSQGSIEGAALTIWLRWLAFGSYFLDGLAHGVEGVAAQARKALGQAEFRHWFVRVVGISAVVGILLGMSVIVGGEPLHRLITDDEAVIAAALSAARYLPLVLLFGGVAYILDGLSVAFAAGSALIAMVSAGAMMTVMVALGLDATGLHLALYGLGAFMVGRVMAGTVWSLRFLRAEKSV